MKTNATYFDGKSSQSHIIEISYDESDNSLLFLSSQFNNLIWKIEDIDFQKLDYCLEVSNKSFPLEMLKINDDDFIENFIGHLHQSGKLSAYNKIMQSGFKIHIVIAVLLIAILTALYIYFIPWIGEKSATIIPTEFDNYLSNTFIVDYLTKNTIDSIKTESLSSFASYLDFKNDKPLTFVVINSDIVNAFALPDGKIVVFTGLLDKMNSYPELTALLCHEAIHINNRHSIKMLARNLAGFIFISVMLSDVNGIMSVIVENAESLQSLSYSRKFEDEADAQGVLLMMHNRVDPKGMITLFSNLKEEKYVVPEFLSTHPVTKDRIESIKVLIGKTTYQKTNLLHLTNLFNRVTTKNKVLK